MDATWHARPRGSATQTRAAPTWRVIYFILFIYYKYKEVFSLRYTEGLLALLNVGTSIPDNIVFYFRVGLKPHFTYHAGDVARRGALDPVDASITRVDRVVVGCTGDQPSTC